MGVAAVAPKENNEGTEFLQAYIVMYIFIFRSIVI